MKESPLTIPKKNSGRDFDFPPRPSLKRPKEGLRPFLWKPSRGMDRGAGFTGDGGTGDGSPERGACGDSGRFALWETRLGKAW